MRKLVGWCRFGKQDYSKITLMPFVRRRKNIEQCKLRHSTHSVCLRHIGVQPAQGLPGLALLLWIGKRILVSCKELLSPLDNIYRPCYNSVPTVPYLIEILGSLIECVVVNSDKVACRCGSNASASCHVTYRQHISPKESIVGKVSVDTHRGVVYCIEIFKRLIRIYVAKNFRFLLAGSKT